ncbi:MAG: S41 family peptidase [Bacteroidales bacterium]|nr:S41 family peptidase [Bacteroidales bacterium]
MRFINIFTTILITFAICGCHRYEAYENDAYGNFDALWQTVDSRYCFFDDKEVDWESVYGEYRARIHPEMTVNEFFDLLSDMLLTLRDGHVNLVAPFNQSYYRAWWTDYPQDFDLRTLQQFYLDFDYRTTGGIIYKILDNDIGYIYYPSFSYTVGEGNLDYILSWFKDCRSLIIDVRDNGGGNMTNINTFVARFIHTQTLGGYIRHKTGPGHNDFSEPYPILYDPAPQTRVHWQRPVAVLTNRSTFSAANDFVSVMKSLPGVKIIGAKTGGGAGLPFTYELPIGWSVRLSTAPVSDAQDESIEGGIDPSEGFECHASAERLAQGHDDILDFALRYLSSLER